MRIVLFFCLLLSAPLAARAQMLDDALSGIYFSAKIGAVFSLDADEDFMFMEENDLGGSDLIAVRQSPQGGFGVNVAAGARFEFDLPFWMRTELELGFHRTLIESRVGIAEQDNRSQMISLVWNNYIHPFAAHNHHQIWVGVGLGGAFARARLSEMRNVAKTSGTSFIAITSLGYDYRLLERSHFSSEYLLVGLTARFLFTEGFRQERAAQTMVVLTYGF